MPLLVSIIGAGRKSGKTQIIESLTRELTGKGYRVCTVKHIHTGPFDTPEKDTWRHLEAGASSVIAVSPTEVVRIKKMTNPTLDTALKEVPENTDVVLVEGFKTANSPKIVVARNIREVTRLLDYVKGVIAIYGPIEECEPDRSKAISGLPVLNSEELAFFIEDMLHKNKGELEKI